MQATLPNWGEVTAVFGGAFDPPHLGHRQAVRGLFANPGVKKVLIMPAANPPHKRTACAVTDRIKMAELSFSSHPGDSFPADVELDLREIKRSESKPNLPSYSFDSLSELKAEYSKLACVVGADQLLQLKTWHRFPELLSLCHWIVLERKPDGQKLSQATLQEWAASGLIQPLRSPTTWNISNAKTILQTFPTEAPELSSTSIRESLAKGAEPETLGLFPVVSAYLKQNRLYGIQG